MSEKTLQLNTTGMLTLVKWGTVKYECYRNTCRVLGGQRHESSFKDSQTHVTMQMYLAGPLFTYQSNKSKSIKPENLTLLALNGMKTQSAVVIAFY